MTHNPDGSLGQSMTTSQLLSRKLNIAASSAQMASFLDGLTAGELQALQLLLNRHSESDSPPLDAAAIIGALPASQVLTPTEIGIFEAERTRIVSSTPAPGPDFSAIIKATRLCNLRCTYCHAWAEGPNQTMSFQVLARIMHETLAMGGVKTLSYFWHGGEITLLKPKFFKKMIWLQQRFKRPGQNIINQLQTNATRLSDEWLDFLGALNVGVGVSLDGPPEVHDLRRVTKTGAPSSELVRAGIRKLSERKIKFGVLMVVDRAVADVSPERLLGYLVEIGVKGVSFLNVQAANDSTAEPSEHTELPFEQYAQFLVRVFDCWQRNYREQVQILNFASLIQALANKQHPSACLWSGDCADKYVTLEANGDIAPCDLMIGTPGSFMGNIMKDSLADSLRNAPFVELARRETRTAIEAMRDCRWLHVCQGGCPHDRVMWQRTRGAMTQACCGMQPVFDRIDAWLALSQARWGREASSLTASVDVNTPGRGE